MSHENNFSTNEEEEEEEDEEEYVYEDAVDYVFDFMNDTIKSNEYEVMEKYKHTPAYIIQGLRQYIPDKGLTLYRGFSFENEDELLQFKDGILQQKRLSSWSKNKEVARGYASGGWGIILSANIGTSSMLVDVNLTHLKVRRGLGNEEIIVLPGTYVVVTSRITTPEENEHYIDYGY